MWNCHKCGKPVYFGNYINKLLFLPILPKQFVIALTLHDFNISSFPQLKEKNLWDMIGIQTV